MRADGIALENLPSSVYERGEKEKIFTGLLKRKKVA